MRTYWFDVNGCMFDVQASTLDLARQAMRVYHGFQPADYTFSHAA